MEQEEEEADKAPRSVAQLRPLKLLRMGDVRCSSLPSSRTYGARYVCRSRRGVAATALSEITQLTKALLAAAARSLGFLALALRPFRGGAEPRAVLPAAPPRRRTLRVADEGRWARRARADGA